MCDFTIGVCIPDTSDLFSLDLYYIYIYIFLYLFTGFFSVIFSGFFCEILN